jgi:hypothetical protein
MSVALGFTDMSASLQSVLGNPMVHIAPLVRAKPSWSASSLVCTAPPTEQSESMRSHVSVAPG